MTTWESRDDGELELDLALPWWAKPPPILPIDL